MMVLRQRLSHDNESALLNTFPANDRQMGSSRNAWLQIFSPQTAVF